VTSAVVISGASTGIGAATTERLARDGFIVFAGVRSENDAQRLRELGANVRPVQLDVTDAAAIEAVRREVADSGISLRAVVSNAGIALGGPLETVPIDELRRQFEVNVFGALALVQAFLPALPPGIGRVVFVGSISGRLATPYIGPYSASKFALRALADALRMELAPANIGVTLIEPGSVKTPIWQKGRAERHRMEERLGPDARPHYRPALAMVIAQTEIEERDGMPVSDVADAIFAAITAPRPPAHQLLGAPAKMGSILAMLPATWRDRAIRKSMKLP
jgi:NAD(P)-dependent dehydrogenase (short-subunit alcohol dehydrogenase family)